MATLFKELMIVMPNGKGSLECCYCLHWGGAYQGYDGAYEVGYCKHHQVSLPSTLPEWGHRVCSDFMPNKFFEHDSNISAEERFSWFGLKLRVEMLYVFNYNAPPQIRELAKLK